MNSNTTIRIICCCRNAETSILKCLESIQNQTFTSFEVVLYIDQCTDNTFEKAKSFVENDLRFRIINGNQRKYAALARWDILQGLNYANQKDIVIFLDGDDWLYDSNSLQKLVAFYNEHEVVVTHGNYITDSGKICDWSSDYPIEVKEINEYRLFPWIATALRSFKYGLFPYLDKSCILDTDGNPFKSATDFALFLPILELSGTHSKYISDTLYVYNERDNDTMKSSRILSQLQNELMIRNKDPYLPLSKSIIETLI